MPWLITDEMIVGQFARSSKQMKELNYVRGNPCFSTGDVTILRLKCQASSLVCTQKISSKCAVHDETISKSEREVKKNHIAKQSDENLLLLIKIK